MKRWLHLIPLVLVLLVITLIVGPDAYTVRPVDAAEATSISGEFIEDANRNDSIKWYTGTVTILSTITTELALSTACPDIDAFMIQYTTSAEDKVPASAFSVPLGTVTAYEVTLVRNTDPSDSSNRVINYTFFDYDWM